MKSDEPPSPFVGVKTAASYLGKSEDTVRRACRDGAIPCYRFTEHGRFQFILAELEKWMRDCAARPLKSTRVLRRPELNEAPKAKRRKRPGMEMGARL